MVAKRCSAKKFSWKFHKIHREIPTVYLQSLSNTVKDLQAVRLATLLKRNPALVFQEQSFVDHLQSRCSWIIHKIQRKTPMLESLFKKSLRVDIHKFSSNYLRLVFFYKVTGLRNTSLLKRDSNTDYFLWNF